MLRLMRGDCLEKMKLIPDNSIDSVVTDPPYGISFMGKKWDYEIPGVNVFEEILRVLKPGGHILCACGTRTQHRMAVNIEDAGFEIRDTISWIYGTGFPKSHNISKAIDKIAGAERKVVGTKTFADGSKARKTQKLGTGVFNDPISRDSNLNIMAPATLEAKQWDGWGTALKPAVEFFTLARKPLSEKTVVDNVLRWGTGGINIDACRIGIKDRNSYSSNCGADNRRKSSGTVFLSNQDKGNSSESSLGRFPSNLILDDESSKVLDEQSGILKSGELKDTYKAKESENLCMGGKNYERLLGNRKPTSGGASRFFYCAKASKAEKNKGLEPLPEKDAPLGDERPSGHSMSGLDGRVPRKMQNTHPTVKPIKLMEYLCKLITPLDGIAMDPFMGSGSTGVACVNLNRNFIGIERDKEYFKIAKQRIKEAKENKKNEI